METVVKATSLSISSPAFEVNGNIPARYTCQGENVNPPLAIGKIPGDTKSMVCIVDDPDAAGSVFDHWIVWNIPPIERINENSVPGIEGENSFGVNTYKGPCPPTGTHRYFFKVYALDTMLDLEEGTDKKTVEEEMKNHILASGELIGQFRKSIE